MELIENAEGVLFDWDGCLFESGSLNGEIAAILKTCEDHAAIVSNQSTLEVSDIQRVLKGADISIPSSRIFLAGVEAIDHTTRAYPCAHVCMTGTLQMKARAKTRGLRLVENHADVVLLLRDPDASLYDLQTAARAVLSGAKIIVSNADRSHPSADGPVAETGAMLAAVEQICGRALDPLIIGKPETTLCHAAAQSIGADAGNCVLIGDNPETDGAAAQKAGLAFVHVDKLRRTGTLRG